MKWYRYFSIFLFIFFIVILIFKFNHSINIKNKEVSKITRGIIDVTVTHTRLKELYFAEEYLESEIFKNKLKSTLINIEKNRNLKNLAPDFFENNIFDSNRKSIDSIENSNLLYYTYLILDLLEKKKIEGIHEIKFIQRKRDFLFIFLVAFTFSALMMEIKNINLANKKVAKHLNNLVYKNYDFEVENSSLPYISSTLREIEKVKNNLNIIDKAINVTLKGYDLNGTLKAIFYNNDFRDYLKFDRIGFATVEDNYFVADISLSESNLLYLKRGFKIKKSHSPSLMKIIKTKKVRIINDLEKYHLENSSSESTRLILQEGYNSSLTAPLFKSDGKIVGILFFSSREKNTYTEEDKYKISSILEIISSIFEKNMLIEDLVTNSVLTFVKLVEGKDPETSNHVERMAYYSKIIAKNLALEEKYKETLDYYFIDNILKFAPLHDIGKVGIPDNILLKPGRLTEEEFEIMKMHPKIGARILSNFHNNLKKYNIDIFKTAIQLTVGHHEKWDGSGYPSGIKGTSIPLAARITAVADVFDAISSKRVYKDAVSFDKSVEIVKDMSGSHFDPDVVKAFIKGLPEIRHIYNNLKEV